MQRKQLLKGQVYRANHRNLIRVLDTAESPVPSETYDLVNQVWVPGTTQPRDIDGPFAAISASDLVDYAQVLKAAWDRRYNLAVLDAVNNEYATHVTTNAGRKEYSLSIRPSGEDRQTVTITADDYATLTQQAVLPPLAATVELRMQHFVVWAIDVLQIEVPEVAKPERLPGAPDDLIDDTFVEALVEALENYRTDVERAREIENRLAGAACEAEIKRIELESGKRPYIGPHRFKDTVAPEVDVELKAAGLRREVHLESRVSSATVLHLQEWGYLKV